MKEHKSFLLKLFMFFSVKTKVKTLMLWEKNGFHIRSSIHDLKRENWLVKQPIWILGILESNWEALFYIIGIKALLGCFLASFFFVSKEEERFRFLWKRNK